MEYSYVSVNLGREDRPFYFLWKTVHILFIKSFHFGHGNKHFHLSGNNLHFPIYHRVSQFIIADMRTKDFLMVEKKFLRTWDFINVRNS